MAMDTYYMGRNDLLAWINSTLTLRLTKIEECSTGAIPAQLMDALHPGLIQLQKVDFNAKNEYDYINNWKQLQFAITKLGVDKEIDVQKLIKGKTMDNLEFLQWFKNYFDQQTAGLGVPSYDGAARRAIAKTGDFRPTAGGSGAPAPPPAATRAPVAAPKKTGITNGTASRAYSTFSNTGAAKTVPTAKPASRAMSSEDLAQVEEWKQKAEAFEKEKVFYYSKLRDIEMLCQTPVIMDIPIVRKVEEILYAATEADGRKALQEAQMEFAGQVYADTDWQEDIAQRDY